jgi:signal transduction histidine kinase
MPHSGPWVAFLTAVAMLDRADANPPAVLSTARQVAESYLLPEPRPPVDLEAEVLGALPANAVILRDETGTTFVLRPYAGPAAVPGDRVRVRGAVYDGACINGIHDATLEKISAGVPPKPRPIHPADLATGERYHDLVTLSGIGRLLRHEARVGPVLLVHADGAVVEVRCEPPLSAADAARLVDAELEITGFGAGEANAARQIVRPFVRVVTADGIRVVAAPPADPFAADAVPLDRLDRSLRSGRRIKVAGVAAARGGTGGGVFIVAGDRGLFVEPAENDAAIGRIEPGDRVEAVGFPVADSAAISLAAATVRVVGHDPPPQPRRLPDQKEFADDAEWYAYFRDLSCDALPIVIEFDVQSRSDGRAGTELVGVLPLDRLRVVCRCPDPLPAAVAPGSRVRVQGVCRVTATKRHEFFAQPGAFDIWPASAADVVVIRPARWWTTRRLATTLGIATAVLAAALGWVALLRRQVARQARDLAMTMQTQHDATIEFETALRERNRLAANLHDTVLQTVTGIGYQLQVVQALGSRPGGHDAGRLAVAGRMVDHAIQQLRGTVWALHTQPGGGQPLAASLETLVARLGEGRDARIDLRVEGKETEVSEFVAGNLLLLVQEAITNALKHAAARTIEVTAAFGGDGALAVTIRDDGRGFQPGAQPGPAQGHFGIEAMMDRMQAVGGRLAIDSREGRGTTVTAIVPEAAADDLSDRAGGPVAVDG